MCLPSKRTHIPDRHQGRRGGCRGWPTLMRELPVRLVGESLGLPDARDQRLGTAKIAPPNRRPVINRVQTMLAPWLRRKAMSGRPCCIDYYQCVTRPRHSQPPCAGTLSPRWVATAVQPAHCLATLVTAYSERKAEVTSLLRSMSYSPGRSGRTPIFSTAVGTQRGPFGWLEWLLLAGVALIWGSSYLLIDIGLDALAPPVITWIRVTLGFAVLIGFPAARRPIDRTDWPRITVVAIVWTTFPFLLSPISQQHIDSALAGMINALIPIFAACIGMAFLRTLPGIRQTVGLLLGLAGAISLGLPAASGSPAAAWGILLAVVAAVFYGLGLNLTIPLQQRYGATAMLMRVLGVSAVATAPFGIAGLSDSTWELGPVVAVTVLGIVNTGAAFVIMVLFAGRVGPTRGGRGDLLPADRRHHARCEVPVRGRAACPMGRDRLGAPGSLPDQPARDLNGSPAVGSPVRYRQRTRRSAPVWGWCSALTYPGYLSFP